MKLRTDDELLHDYAESHSEAAFAELVRRHVDLVFSAALRMVCDPHLAEDVTQATFAALGQQARHLSSRTVLAGWLHRTAQNIAAQTVRTEVRRRAREQESAAMNTPPAPDSAPDWQELAPHVDAALEELVGSDRDALLLRYFQHQSAAEMAATLGISAEAAQKRVSRALDRLRDTLARRGLAVGAGGLALLLTTHAVQAAPVALAGAISVPAATAAHTAVQALAMTTLQKTLLGTAIAVTLVTAVGTGVYVARLALKMRPPTTSPTSPAPTKPSPPGAQEFTFQMGQHLNGDVAPAIAGRSFNVTAVFESRSSNGVIVAQGGLAHGYALYLDGGQIFFALRRNNALTVATAGPVGPGRHAVTGQLSTNGTLSVTLDRQPPGTAQAAGVITMTPVDGLDIGADKGGAVGPYIGENPFDGVIEAVVVRLFP